MVVEEMGFRKELIIVLLFWGIIPCAAQSNGTTIAFVSDTQAPMWIETLFLTPYYNEEATDSLFNRLIEEKPSQLFLLGDVVAAGSKPRQWSATDRRLNHLRTAGIPYHAVMGNHDVMYNARRGERNFSKRFPDHNWLYKQFIVDSMAILMLNSNFKKLADDEMTRQVVWLESTLRSADNNPSILFTIVTCHHAPYTNSKTVGMNEHVQTKWVPLVKHSRKAKLFITGHAHTFEHFHVDGIDFLTIGGGGGLQQNFIEANRLADLAASYKPRYHFLRAQRNGKQLTLTSVMLSDDFRSRSNGYSITIVAK